MSEDFSPSPSPSGSSLMPPESDEEGRDASAHADEGGRLAYRFAPPTPPALVMLFPRTGFRVELETEASLRIGRDPRRNDVALLSPSVSQRHCLLRVDDDECFITDLESSNGTMVNGERIQGERPLRSGDLVNIGVYVLLFIWPRFAVEGRADALDLHKTEETFVSLYPTSSDIQTLLLASGLFNLPVELKSGTADQIWNRIFEQLRRQDLLVALERMIAGALRDHPGNESLLGLHETLQSWRSLRRAGSIQTKINRDVQNARRLVRLILEHHLQLELPEESIRVEKEGAPSPPPGEVVIPLSHKTADHAPAPKDLPFELRPDSMAEEKSGEHTIRADVADFWTRAAGHTHTSTAKNASIQEARRDLERPVPSASSSQQGAPRPVSREHPPASPPLFGPAELVQTSSKTAGIEDDDPFALMSNATLSWEEKDEGHGGEQAWAAHEDHGPSAAFSASNAIPGEGDRIPQLDFGVDNNFDSDEHDIQTDENTPINQESYPIERQGRDGSQAPPWEDNGGDSSSSSLPALSELPPIEPPSVPMDGVKPAPPHRTRADTIRKMFRERRVQALVAVLVLGLAVFLSWITFGEREVSPPSASRTGEANEARHTTSAETAEGRDGETIREGKPKDMHSKRGRVSSKGGRAVLKAESSGNSREGVPMVPSYALLNFLGKDGRPRYSADTLPAGAQWDPKTGQIRGSSLRDCRWLKPKTTTLPGKGRRRFLYVRCMAGSEPIEGWVVSGGLKKRPKG